MGKGILKVKHISGKIYPQLSVPSQRLTVAADQEIEFDVAWDVDVRNAASIKPVTWFRQNTARDEVIESDTLAFPTTYKFRIPKMLCGSYYYFIDASLTGIPNTSAEIGLYVRGFCQPKIIRTKWSIQVDGEDVRKVHEFSYGDPICLNVETEGINGDMVIVELYRQVSQGRGLNDDKLVIIYTDALVQDGEINIIFKDTFTWRAAKPKQVELFYVKIKTQDGKYLDDGKDIAHARYLRVKNVVSSEKVETPQNKTAVKIGDTDKSSERIGLATVYFRPLDSWTGEFGFDWLREDDNGLAAKDDPAYKDIIEAGYLDGVHELTKGPEGTAYAKLKNMYQRMPVEKTGHNVSEYFAPHLTLFSKQFVDSMPSGVLLKPKYEAELKILVSIFRDIDRLEFEYDKEVFSIDKNILSDKEMTAGLVPSKDVSIKISCKKDFSSDKEIKIYCYPLNEQPRILAGKLIVVKNDEKTRKKVDIALVEVKTNILNLKNNGMEQGLFLTAEMSNLYKVLYQALIVPNIIKIKLNLSENANFRKGGVYVDSGKGRNTIAVLDKSDYRFSNKSLYITLRSEFITSKDSAGNYPNAKYADYFTVFKFAMESNSDGLLGETESIGAKNAIVFTFPDVNNNHTLGHEVLHGLGLYHSHRNSAVLGNKNAKFIFPCAIENPPFQTKPNDSASTDNFMSYRSILRSTWRWQWHIINPKISER